ncbi:alpha/beta fold hydrolase [Plastoroseomonas arctica]|uniref:Alpha/beta hydrolase n=1 Tax=Plastoroseomonas arctica TaxID=1509237 RepID=A0AAF1JYL5_9PROT|nr:alpha/beta hydrolase [Plastoroseomonas arctica]MBR0657107.1 alpha/beta hydrolase [Plastoroseomonas arctica]
MTDTDGAEAQLNEIQSKGTRHETPGGVVWHSWGQGPPIVLLHGAAGSWRHWLHNVIPLSARHQVICADMPGYGDSALPPAPVTLENFAALLLDGIDTLIPRTPFALVGFSLGATIAGQIAHMLGHRVTRLILVGSGGLTPANFVEMERVRDKLGAARTEAHRENLRRIMIHQERNIDALALAAQAWNSDHSRLRLRGALPQMTLRRLLPEITAPTDAIWGEFDQPAKGNLQDRIDVLKALKPDADISVIPNAGHWVAYEAADEVNAAIEARLGK